MIRATDYYRNGELLAAKFSDIKLVVDALAAYAADNNARVFWRGQKNHEWGLTASLVRKLSASAAVDDDILRRVERAVLSEATDWVSDLRTNAAFAEPLAALAYLQHHGVPTRLLDFSKDPWTATFFAADAPDEIDGRLFALVVPEAAVMRETPQGTPWDEYGQDEVKIFDPTALNFPRLVAQQGVFAVGRLPSTQPYRSAFDPVLGQDKKRALLAEEVRRILSIPFALSDLKIENGAVKLPQNAALPFGLTIRLHVDKASIRSDIAGPRQGNRVAPTTTAITHKKVYPDVAGLVENSPLLKGIEKGVLLLSSEE